MNQQQHNHRLRTDSSLGHRGKRFILHRLPEFKRNTSWSKVGPIQIQALTHARHTI